MSYTEIYSFNKKGNAEFLGETKNSWRGAMAIWEILEKKYLEPLPKPNWMTIERYNEGGYSRTSLSDNGLAPIWALYDSDKIDKIYKIVLGTTFDYYIVMKENINEVIEAFENFKGETSLKEQAIIISEILDDPDVIAIGWNQTSVNGDNWTNYNYDEVIDDHIPYNLYDQNEHYNLFE